MTGRMAHARHPLRTGFIPDCAQLSQHLRTRLFTTCCGAHGSLTQILGMPAHMSTRKTPCRDELFSGKNKAPPNQMTGGDRCSRIEQESRPMRAGSGKQRGSPHGCATCPRTRIRASLRACAKAAGFLRGHGKPRIGKPRINPRFPRAVMAGRQFPPCDGVRVGHLANRTTYKTFS